MPSVGGHFDHTIFLFKNNLNFDASGWQLCPAWSPRFSKLASGGIKKTSYSSPTNANLRAIIQPRQTLSDAGRYHEYGYRFVPLVREEWSLTCSLNILFLRRDILGNKGVLSAGDIDNRVKTLIDVLRRPRNQTELVGNDATPREDEDPFFVLLEDDKQVSHLLVEADTLLIPPCETDASASQAKVVVTVEIRPYYVTTFNLSLALG